MESNNPVLNIIQLGISYKKKNIINCESFSVSSNEVVLIQGPNGSGKTSILHAIIGKIKKNNGRIEYNNDPLTNKNIRNFRKSISYVQQNDDIKIANTPYGYVKDSYLRSLSDDKEVDKKEVEKRVKSLFEYFDKLDIMDSSVKTLSGGELRITSIISGLVRESDLYLFDEPINKLDHKTAKKVGMYIEKLKNSGRAILIITHCRMFLQASTAYKLEDNRIIKLEKVPKPCII